MKRQTLEEYAKGKIKQKGEMMGVADAAVAIVGLICVTVLCCVSIHNEADCKEHEEIHNEDFSKKSNREISDRLFYLYSFGYKYRFGNKVMGMPINSFESLMYEAAQRLREVKDE